jgi:ribokinase
MTPKIVVVGSFNSDLVTYMERLPQIGETVSAREFTTWPGGKGSNQAVAAARLGADVTLIARIGQDSFADIGMTLWRREGINTQYVVKDANSNTGLATVYVEDSGEDMIVVTLGANLALCAADVDAATSAIQDADMLLVQLEIPLETVAHALMVAKKLGVRTLLNPGPATPLPSQITANADYLTPNETELQTLTGGSGYDIEEHAQHLLVTERQTAVVTIGAGGALWVNKIGHGHISGFPVDAVDTVGAGDAFSAGLAVALAEGRDLPDAIAFANAAAAICVTRPGAAPSMPKRYEVDALLRERQSGDDE